MLSPYEREWMARERRQDLLREAAELRAANVAAPARGRAARRWLAAALLTLAARVSPTARAAPVMECPTPDGARP